MYKGVSCCAVRVGFCEYLVASKFDALMRDTLPTRGALSFPRGASAAQQEELHEERTCIVHHVGVSEDLLRSILEHLCASLAVLCSVRSVCAGCALHLFLSPSIASVLSVLSALYIFSPLLCIC